MRGAVWMALLALLTSACGDSSKTSVTSPTPSRCEVTATAQPSSVDAPGGSVDVAVTANRECAWEARSDSDWLTLRSGGTGQGDGTIRYAAAANALVTTRQGTVSVNDRHLAITQAAAPCVFSLDRVERSVGSAGGRHDVAVSAQGGCAWTAISDESWITVVAGASGQGAGTVSLVVAPNPAVDARTGSVRLAGQRYQVDQAGTPPPPPPTPTPGPPPPAPAPEPTPPAPAPTPTPAPSPTPAPTPPPAPAPTPPPAPPPTPPPAPPPACDYTISPSPVEVGFGGSNDIDVHLVTGRGCAWTAVSQASWITVKSGASGTDDGHVHLAVGATLLANGRTGSVLIAGRAIAVNQAGILNQDVTIEGTIANISGACPNRAFTVDGTAITTNGGTNYPGKTECGDLRDGRKARVQGRGVSDGSILATKIDKIDEKLTAAAFVGDR